MFLDRNIMGAPRRSPLSPVQLGATAQQVAGQPRHRRRRQASRSAAPVAGAKRANVPRLLQEVTRGVHAKARRQRLPHRRGRPRRHASQATHAGRLRAGAAPRVRAAIGPARTGSRASGTTGAACGPPEATRPAAPSSPDRPADTLPVQQRPPTPEPAEAASQSRAAPGTAEAPPPGRGLSESRQTRAGGPAPQGPGRRGNPPPAFKPHRQPPQPCPGQKEQRHSIRVFVLGHARPDRLAQPGEGQAQAVRQACCGLRGGQGHEHI